MLTMLVYHSGVTTIQFKDNSMKSQCLIQDFHNQTNLIKKPTENSKVTLWPIFHTPELRPMLLKQ